MSIQAIAWVLENSKSEFGDRLVLLAIANHADGSWCCFPSIPQIALEARMSTRSVYRCVDSLVQMGELEVARNRGRGNRNTYRIAFYKRCQDVTLNQSFKVTSVQEKVTNDALKGDTAVTHNRKEPSWNPHAGAREALRERQTWVSDGALEASSEEERQHRLALLRDYRRRNHTDGQATG